MGSMEMTEGIFQQADPGGGNGPSVDTDKEADISEVFSKIPNSRENKEGPSLHYSGPWETVVCLGLLCVLLSAAIAALTFKMIESKQLQSTYEEKLQLQSDYDNMTTEYQQLQIRYSSVQKERSHLQDRNNNLTGQISQLQTNYVNLLKVHQQKQSSYSDLTKENHQLQIINSDLKREKSQLQYSNNNLSAENSQLQDHFSYLNRQKSQLQTNYSQLQISYNNLNNQKLQLQDSHNHLYTEKSQLQNKYNSLNIDMTQLERNYSNLNRHKSNLEIRYKSLIGEQSQLQESYNRLHTETSLLQDSYNTVKTENIQLLANYQNLTKYSAQLQTDYSNLTGAHFQLQTLYNNQTRQNSQLQTLYNNLTRQNSQLQGRFNTLAAERSKLQQKLSNPELEFTQYSVNVTLDVDTANRYLILSADGKEVRIGPRLQTHNDNPKRFNPVISVLGKQGFTSGRFYYDVQVRGKIEWDLGIATESISRKGQTKLSPTNGYWAIWMRNNEYMALDDQRVQLCLKGKLDKVGVFVDYEAGVVSFFNAESWNLIYSYRGVAFKEMIYPYFSPGLTHGGRNLTPLIITNVK